MPFNVSTCSRLLPKTHRTSLSFIFFWILSPKKRLTLWAKWQRLSLQSLPCIFNLFLCFYVREAKEQRKAHPTKHAFSRFQHYRPRTAAQVNHAVWGRIKSLLQTIVLLWHTRLSQTPCINSTQLVGKVHNFNMYALSSEILGIGSLQKDFDRMIKWCLRNVISFSILFFSNNNIVYNKFGLNNIIKESSLCNFVIRISLQALIHLYHLKLCVLYKSDYRSC